MMLAAVFAALAPFISQILPLITKLATAPTEQHAAIVKELQDATAALQAALGGLPGTLAKDDAAADAALHGK